MATHIRTGTMVTPNTYQSRTLDHLGLVAGMYDELGIGEVLDRLVPQKRQVSVGQAVKAMVLNGLGFVDQRLYLTPRFFEDKPTERLVGAGIEAAQLNDDTLGRTLDELYQKGVTQTYLQVAPQAMQRLGVGVKACHLDSTSFHTDGRYNSDSGAEEGVIHITRGYSRDHRPDLNQVSLQLIVDQQAGIPLLMKPLSGNSDDKTEFRHTLNAYLSQLQTTYPESCWIADSALYTAETLPLLSNTWLTRVPATLKTAQLLLQAVDPAQMLPLGEGVWYTPLSTTYAQVPQRWLVIYSEAAQRRARPTLQRQWLKRSDAEHKAWARLCQRAFAYQPDAEKALAHFRKTQALTTLEDIQIIPVAHYSGRGRPTKDQTPDQRTYHLQGALASRVALFRQRLYQESSFILATNDVAGRVLSDTEILPCYKGQHCVERGFRFLKDPLFMASTLYLKSPKRIMALMLVMTLCLLVYAALEYRIRQSLQHHQATFPNQQGKPIQHPTARWVFQYFTGIHLLQLPDQHTHLVLNLKDPHLIVLQLLGPPYQKIYY
jgi:transposase